MMKRNALAFVLLALWLVVGSTWAGVAGKGTPRTADVILTEGFESESWRIAWTVVDREGSGGSWERLGLADFFQAHGGSWSLGCRYNEDGQANDDWLITPPMRPDTLKHLFTIYYRSQDPNHPETVDFYGLHVESAIPAAELTSRLDDFTLLRHETSVPIEWQLFSHDVDYEEGGVWYFAVRCASQDRFVLLVDDALGFWTVPQANWHLEPQYERLDFGLHSLDSLLRRFRLWNLSETDSMEVTVAHRPLPPFVMESAWLDTTFFVRPEDSLGVLTGVYSVTASDGDTTRHLGSFADSLVLEIFHYAGDLARLSIPFTVSFWLPDSLEGLLLHQDFEDDSLEGWTPELGPDGNDPLGWEFGRYVSSANFTVPAASRFAYLNSDARGRFTPGGTALVQDAWLLTPWMDVSQTAEGDPARGLLLGWDQVYDNRAGGLLQVMADSTGSAWHAVGSPLPSAEWAGRDLDLSRWAGRDSLRLAFRFTGSWSYGAALDNIVLLAIADELPGMAPPSTPPRPASAEIVMAPNPFNPITQVRYLAVAPGRLVIQVYNLLGQRVMERGPYLLRTGPNAFPLDFGRMASGAYLVRLVSTDATGRSVQHLRRVTFLK